MLCFNITFIKICARVQCWNPCTIHEWRLGWGNYSSEMLQNMQNFEDFQCAKRRILQLLHARKLREYWYLPKNWHWQIFNLFPTNIKNFEMNFFFTDYCNQNEYRFYPLWVILNILSCNHLKIQILSSNHLKIQMLVGNKLKILVSISFEIY